jgi:hypothetical protein
MREDTEMLSLFRDAKGSLRELTRRLMSAAQESGMPPVNFVTVITPLYLSHVINIMKILNKSNNVFVDKEYFLHVAEMIWDGNAEEENNSGSIRP